MSSCISLRAAATSPFPSAALNACATSSGVVMDDLLPLEAKPGVRIYQPIVHAGYSGGAEPLGQSRAGRAERCARDGALPQRAPVPLGADRPLGVRGRRAR